MADRLPFGKDSRLRILRQHFAEAGTITAETAWKFIYRELLWIDGSTGLAHLYESDKAQQGRRWYDRTVVFTDMLCQWFGNISREELKQQIDRLFRAVLEKAIRNPETTPDVDDLTEAPTTSQAQVEFPDEIVQATIGAGKDHTDELDSYLDLLSQDEFPQYVLITNEYDPGRLINTDGLNRRGHRINCIYHINLELLLGALRDHSRAKDLNPLIAAGHLQSFEDFLNDLSQKYGSQS